MMRAHFEGGLPFKVIGPMFNTSKSVAHAAVKEYSELFPAYKDFLVQLRESPERSITKEEITDKIRRQQESRNAVEAENRFKEICQDLAKAIDETIAHLLDMDPNELKSMKTEHKLRHIPELIKTSRLLKDQSTENVEQLSLVKAVSIATERRKARKNSK
jgi:predicted DNA-binding protein YlxM (UPF0122 family)